MTDFNDTTSPLHPESWNFGQGVSAEAAQTAGTDWAKRGWKTDHLAPPPQADGHVWAGFLIGAKSAD